MRWGACKSVGGLLVLSACNAVLADSYMCGAKLADHEFDECRVDQFRIGPNGVRTQVPKRLTPAEIKAKA
jgi:hypothetical protein